MCCCRWGASIALPDAAGIRSRQDGQITNWQAAGERTGALQRHLCSVRLLGEVLVHGC